ncbi:DUF3761 domain-containing protein [Ralstonia solanacearum]
MGDCVRRFRGPLQYSFSESRRGTCSRHGGVADWLQ